jgi:CxxC motif-containing protein (DUF1111 family)
LTFVPYALRLWRNTSQRFRFFDHLSSQKCPDTAASSLPRVGDDEGRVEMSKSCFWGRLSLTAIAALMLGATALSPAAHAQQTSSNRGGTGGSGATDPGVRGGAPGAGGPVAGLTTAQSNFFTAAQGQFEAVLGVAAGLGPGFNLNSCGGCHAQPAVGGSSPATNPQVAVATLDGATNVIPPFIAANGPIREARFVLNPNGTPDGSVHDLFSIQGRSDAPGCVFAQPNFAAQLAKNNVIFRIPINTFGDGLVEGVSDLSLENAFAARAQQNASLGISGNFNVSGNTGNITRFGWKAQNPSLHVFTGEAYNVEEGITNDLFPDKRGLPSPACAPTVEPNDSVFTVDVINSASTASDLIPHSLNFTMFMRLLAPPTPAVPFTTSTTASTTSSSTGAQVASTSSVLSAASGSAAPSTSSSSTSTASAASITAGFQAFTNIGCSGCHIVNQTTVGNLALIDSGDQGANPNVSNIAINAFSDYAVHNMGAGLADGVTQGIANGSQFRTAPLWGVGQRIFFLHDGRTNNLLTAIEQHASSGSEANTVIQSFNMLSTTQQQNILNFLRDL